MKGRDIIVIGIQPWDIEIGSNCKNIAREFAKNNRVLYVNPPLDTITLIRERKTEKVKKRLEVKRGREKELFSIGPNLWNLYPNTRTRSINWINSRRLFDRLNRQNACRFAKDIEEAIKLLGFENYILFNDSSMFLGLHMKELLGPVMYVYYMRDYLTKNRYWRKHGARLEPEVIRKADLVVNNSLTYAEYGAKFNPNSFMIGQGCDVSLFNNQENEVRVTEDLKDIPRPIIGYVGYLTGSRLSVDIIAHLAESNKNWSVVLVGPEDEHFKRSKLHQMGNVYFLGSREPSELPRYIQGFDVAMNPQLINDATIGNYPRKIDEYLAMGKPTLASATKAMEYFSEYTYLGVTKEDYVRLAHKALEEDSPQLQEARREYGTSHSWKNNVNEIYKYIELVAKKKNLSL